MNALLLFVLCANLLLLGALGACLPKERRLGKRLPLMIGLGLFLPGLSLVLYAHLGQAWLADHPAEQRRQNLTQKKLTQERLTQKNLTQDERSLDTAALAAQQSFAALSPEERAERIRAMVDKLSQRLQRNGGAPQEWLRLARAQSVLRAKDKARDALERAEESHPALKSHKAWLAASVAVLLSSPLDEKDKLRMRRQLAEAKARFGDDDTDIKTLESKLLPLLQ